MLQYLLCHLHLQNKLPPHQFLDQLHDCLRK
jgi:hypothetical protein